MDAPEQILALEQPTDILSHADKLPLLVAELVRQREGMIGRLRRMSCGTFELFSRNADSFFVADESKDIPEAPDFKIKPFESLSLNDRTTDDVVKQVLAARASSSQFFCRVILRKVGVSPGRDAARVRKGRDSAPHNPQFVLQVFRGGLSYDYDAVGC